MLVKHNDFHGRKAIERSVRVEDFTARTLLNEERYDDMSRVCLENQPERVALAMGRLMDLLLAKGIISPGEFFHVVGLDYLPPGKNLRIVPEEE